MLIRPMEWIMLIVPWFSLFFMNKEKLKQYMPVAIFTALLMTIYHEIAFTQKFWIGQPLFSWLVVYASFVYGPFLIGTLWIFRFTFGKFWLYCLTNIVVDGAFLFGISLWFERVGFYHLVTRTRWMIMIDWLVVSIIVYGYQLWQSGALLRRKTDSDGIAKVKRGFGFREKAR